jgi:hypothetical protein
MNDMYPSLSTASQQALVWWRLMGRRYDLQAVPVLLAMQPVEDLDMTLHLLTTIQQVAHE